MGHGIIIGSNFSFTFIDNVFWLIILSRFFIRGWYITTNDTPWLPLSFLFVFICSTFVNFLPCHKSEPPLTHFLNVFCWLLLCLWMIACYMNELANFYSSCLFFNALFTYYIASKSYFLYRLVLLSFLLQMSSFAYLYNWFDILIFFSISFSGCYILRNPDFKNSLLPDFKDLKILFFQTQSIYSKVPNHKSAYGERVGGVWGQIFFLRLL